MVQSVQLIGIDLEQLKSIIKGAVTKTLHEHKDLFNGSKKEYQDEYLSRKEAAEFLKISETTLWSLDKDQTLPATRLNGKVLYLKSDLLNLPKQSA